MTTLAEFLEQRGEQRGIFRGREEGERNTKITIAKNLLRNGASIELVKNSTGLSDQEIEQLLR